MKKFLLLSLLLLLNATSAVAQVGFIVRPNSSSITNPVSGQTWWANSTNNTLNVWNGSSYLVASAPQNNFSASVNPTTANDNTQGYSAGSNWYNTSNHNTYICVSAATSAAIWVQTNNLGSLSIPLTALQQGGAAGGQSLIYNSGSGHWAPGSPAINLNQLVNSGALNGQVPMWNGSAWVPVTASGMGGGVSYVGLSSNDFNLFTISGSPVTSAGTFGINFANQPKFTVYAGPSFNNFAATNQNVALSSRYLPNPIPQPPYNGYDGTLPSNPLPFSTTPGAVTEYPVTYGAADIVCGPGDGNVWYTQPSNNTFSKMSTSGSVTDYHQGGSSAPTAICYGPDGNLYVTDPGQVAILQVDPQNGTVLNTFAVPGTTSPTFPSICTGYDGQLWFTDPSDGILFTMTTSGSFNSTNNLGGAIIPQYICAGPNGRMYFTFPKVSSSNGLIVEVDSGFSSQGWFVPSSGIPDRICCAHGKIWFTCPNINSIGEFDPANFSFGGQNIYPITGSNTALGGICAASDNKVVFIENTANQFGWMNLQGVVINETPFTTSSANGLNVAVGPDGAIYAIENGVNKIVVQAQTMVTR